MAANQKEPKIKQPLTPAQQDTLRLRLSGMNASEIAEEMDCHLDTVYTRLRSEGVKSALMAYQESLMDEVSGILQRAAAPAAKYLTELAEDKDEESKERRMAAIAILDRSGHGPTSRTEVTGADGATLGIVLKAEEFEAERDRLMAELAEAKAK